MPTPLPANSTQRWFYDYACGTYSHTFVVRGRPAVTLSDVDDAVALILGDIGSLFTTSVMTGVRYALAGSDVTNAVPSDRISDTWGTGTPTAYHAATTMSFTGRDPAGYKARFFLFGFKEALLDYRLLTSESTPVLNAVNHLNSFGDAFDTVNGMSATWNSYANLGVNDHWMRKVRA